MRMLMVTSTQFVTTVIVTKVKSIKSYLDGWSFPNPSLWVRLLKFCPLFFEPASYDWTRDKNDWSWDWPYPKDRAMQPMLTATCNAEAANLNAMRHCEGWNMMLKPRLAFSQVRYAELQSEKEDFETRVDTLIVKVSSCFFSPFCFCFHFFNLRGRAWEIWSGSSVLVEWVHWVGGRIPGLWRRWCGPRLITRRTNDSEHWQGWFCKQAQCRCRYESKGKKR